MRYSSRLCFFMKRELDDIQEDSVLFFFLLSLFFYLFFSFSLLLSKYLSIYMCIIACISIYTEGIKLGLLPLSHVDRFSIYMDES